MAEARRIETSKGERSSSLTNHDEVVPLEHIPTNNIRPACFKNTIQEILFVLTATMATAMTSFLGGSVTVTSSYIGRS